MSENVHDRFGSMGVVTYPGPVGIEDANGDQKNFMGEVTFKTNILDRVTIHVNQFKKINKKGCGNIPKGFKKSVPTPKSAPNSNDSTPKNARKGPLIQTNNPNPNTLQDDLLKEFVDEEKISQRKRTGQLLNGKPAITMAYTLGKRHPQVWHSSVKPLQIRLMMSTKHGKTWQATMKATKSRKTRYQGRSTEKRKNPKTANINRQSKK